ncbi:MAG: hypothetical protein JO247_16190 [Chloroflexi bacterium]|nr:hypothetical protein [Chloroflexota bacterium]
MNTRTPKVLGLGLVLTLLLAACSPQGAISQVQTIAREIPGAFGSGGHSTAVTAPQGSAEAAIELVIQRGDFEQEQAIGSQDSSGMKDTSTDSYFQQVAAQNQDLIANGVTAIKLVNLEWGQISVTGSTATANDWETWQTTYSDGSSDQTRDHNVYTLVQQSGQWKIQDDAQPDQPSSPSPVAQPGGAGSSGRPNPVASSNPRASAAPAVQSSGRGSASPQSSGSGSLTIAAQPGTTEAAIQQVILMGNQEQEQAVAKNDPSVMKDTSTDSYYQDIAQETSDMINNGVSAIKLVSIQWGPVTVSGSSATATTFETWSTTYSDGSTDQSTDRNVYSLVQQNGQWKVQSDDHPDDALTTVPGAPSPSGAPSPAGSPAPRGTRGRGESSNWSGYSATGGKFTTVSGTWTIPQVAASNGQLGADAAWVGIGGTSTRDLIQAGTEETALSSGKVQYDAWIEMLPQYSHPIPMPVHPGDSVTVTIAQQQSGDWQVSFKDNTTGGTYERTVQYNSSLSSAEWIEEAPSGGRGGIMPLDNFGSIQFSNASAVKDGQTVNLQQAGAQPITMINAGDQPLVTPSVIGNDGSSFTVTRTSNSSSTGGGRTGGVFPRTRPSPSSGG